MSTQQLKELCQKAIKQGDLNSALNYINQVIYEGPEDYHAYASRAGIYNCQRKYDLAIIDTEKSIELNDKFLNSHIQQGFAFYQMGLLEEAKASLKRALALDKENKQVKELLNRCNEKKQDEQFTEQDMLRDVVYQLQIHPVYIEFLQDREFMHCLEILAISPQLKEILMRKNKKLKEVMDYLYNQNIKNKPKNLETMFKDQEKTLEQEDIQENQDQQNKINENQENQNNNNSKKKDFFFKCWGDDQQKQDFESALQYKNEGNQFFKDKQYEQALDKFIKAVELDREDLNYLNSLILCYLKLNQIEKAEEQINNCLKQLRQKETQIHEKQIISFIIYLPVFNKNYDQKDSENYFVKNKIKILQLAQTQGFLYMQLFLRLFQNFKLFYTFSQAKILHIQKNQLENALKIFEKSQEVVENPLIQAEIQRLSQIVKQQKIYQKNPEYEQADEFLQTGSKLFQNGKIEYAIDEYLKCLKIRENDIKSLLGISNCYVKLKKLQEAMEYVEKVLLIENNLEAWIKKGYLHFFLKDYKSSQASFELALELEYDNKDAIKGKEKAQAMIKLEEQEQKETPLRQALQDSEMIDILQNPEMRNLLEYLNKNPQDLKQIMENSSIASNLQKLIDCGLLQISQKNNDGELEEIEEKNEEYLQKD